MAISDFYMIGTGVGSNLNAGSTISPTPIFSDVGSNGSWNGTSTYTPTSGVTPASTVNVNDWVSIYTNQSATPYIAQVTSVGTGANGVITLSTSAKFGTAPASSAVANCIDGGAWADLGMLASGAALNTGTVTQSTRVNMQAGTYANTTTTRAFGLAGAATTPLIWRGFETSPGDQDTNLAAVAATNIPSFTFTTGQLEVTGNFQIFMNIDVNGAATTNGQLYVSSAADLTFSNVRSTNTHAGSGAFSVFFNGANTAFVGCYFKATTTATECVDNAASTAYLSGCYFGGGTVAIGNANESLYLEGCIFDSQSGDGVTIGSTAATEIQNCSFYNQGGNGINITTVSDTLIKNCYFEKITTASKAAINNTSGGASAIIRCVGNAYYDCTANTSGLGDTPVYFDKGTLGSAGFVAASSQNFAPAAVLKGIGFPLNFPNLPAFENAACVGAVEAGSGGGATAYAF
jgi:hypothetical protein